MPVFSAPTARAFALAFALVTGTTRAAHSDPLDPAPEPYELPPVIVEGVLQRPERDLFSAGSVVRPGERPAALSVGDLVEGLPGVQVRSAGGPGQRQSLALRGADGQQTLVLLDDVPLNSAVGGGVDLSMLPLFGFDRVEIYRGGSAMLGADAIGGALRIVSGPAPKEPVSRFRTGGGSFGTAMAAAAHAGRYDALDVQASASYLHSEGAFPFTDSNGASRTRSNNVADVMALSARVAWAASRSVELRIADHVQGALRGVPGVEQFPTGLAASESVRNAALVGVVARDAGAEGLDLDVQAFHRLDLFHFEDPEPYLPPAVDNRHASHAAGGHAQLTWYWGEHQIVGARVEGKGDWARIDRTDSVAQEPSRGSFGLLVSDEVTFFDGALAFMPAIRLDLAEGFSPAFVPKLGLTVKPIPELAVHANVGRAYRLPTFEELYYDAGQVKGNPYLGPEDAISIDAGVSLDLRLFSADVTWFRLQIDNLILFLPETAFLIRANDSKDALSQGVEASLRVQPLTELSVSASYTFEDARFADTERRLPARSPHRLSGRLDWRAWRLDGYAGVSWQDRMTLDRFEQLTEEGRVLLDVGLSAEVTSWLRLRVDARNLLDKRDGVDAMQQPLPGFSVLGAAQVEL